MLMDQQHSQLARVIRSSLLGVAASLVSYWARYKMRLYEQLQTKWPHLESYTSA
jgi:hypothetical protein